jgi:hypothetical protein
MGLRGPKPVDVQQLEGEAVQWACFFYTLRDGQSGWMQHVKWAQWQKTGKAKWTPVPAGRGRVMLPPGVRYRSSFPLGPVIPIPVTDAARELPRKARMGKWVVFRPVYPKPEVWEALKEARTSRQVKEAARRIGELRSAFVSSTRWAQKPDDALYCFAKGFLDAKDLPNYPKTDRPKSDDKRVQFLAKVMAGLTLGLAPITAAKRLSHWHWSKDWAERPRREFVEAQEGSRGGEI